MTHLVIYTGTTIHQLSEKVRAYFLFAFLRIYQSNSEENLLSKNTGRASSVVICFRLCFFSIYRSICDITCLKINLDFLYI